MAHLRVTLMLESGDRIGPGKIALLESIQSTGSIAAAARAMEMDYKRAWVLIESLNQAFGSPCVERVIGGPGGGGAKLTALGLEILKLYRRLEGQIESIGIEDLQALEKKASKIKTSKI